MASKDPERYEKEFWERLHALPDSVQQAGVALKKAFDETFGQKDECVVGFRGGSIRSQGGIYRAKAKHVFAVIDPDTRLQAIRVGIHSNAEDLKQCSEGLYIEDSEHSGRREKGPRVQSILLTNVRDVSKVLECASIARSLWGAGKR